MVTHPDGSWDFVIRLNRHELMMIIEILKDRMPQTNEKFQHLLWVAEGRIADDMYEADPVKMMKSVRIEDLELSTRAERILLNQGYETLGDIVALEYEDLVEFPQMGRRTALEILSVTKEPAEFIRYHVRNQLNDTSEKRREHPPA